MGNPLRQGEMGNPSQIIRMQQTLSLNKAFADCMLPQRLQSFTGDRLREDKKGLSAEPTDLADVDMAPNKGGERIDSS